MKYFLFTFLLLFSVLNASGQVYLDLNKQFIELFRQGKYEEAIPVAEKAFALAKKEIAPDHPDYITNLENLGWVYLTAGYYSKAIPVYQELILLKGRAYGKDHPEYATMVNNLAILYYYTGEYVLSEPLYLESMSIRKKVLGEEHPDYLTSLGNLGALYAAVAEYGKAEALYRQAMEIYKKVSGESADDYLTSLNNLASLYLTTGEYVKAEALYLQAAGTRRKTLGEDHPLYATSLNNLGALYLAIGQYEKAETFFIVAYDIRKRVLGEHHPSYLVSINNLSQVYAAKGAYQDAINFCLQVIGLRKEILGENHPDYATSLNNLGVLYTQTGEYAKAEPYCIQAAAIRKKILGESHPDYAASMNNLAIVYKGLHDYTKAASLFLQTLDIYKRFDMVRSPAATITLDNLAVLYTTMGQYAKAETYIVQSSTITMDQLRQTFAVLSENEKGQYLENKNTITEISNSILYNNPGASPAMRLNNFNLQLVLKSLSLADTKNMINAVRNSPDSNTRKMFNRWTTAKNYLATQYSLPLGKRDPDLDIIEGKTESLEKELSRNSQTFRNQQANFMVSAAELQKQLEVDEVAIEFVRFPLYTRRWTDSVIYAACILRKNDPAPVFVPLFEEKQLQQLYDDAGGTAAGAAQSFYRGLIKKDDASKWLGENLYQLIWQPLEPYLKGIRKIAYAPAGKLYAIAFHALGIDSTSLLMDKYQLRQYTSTRQLALRKDDLPFSKPGSIILFGDADFNSIATKVAGQRNITSSFKPVIGAQKNSWSRLPGTGVEVNAIGRLFSEQGITKELHTGTRATEENLKALSEKSPQVIHIATHGYFLPTPDKKKPDNVAAANVYTLTGDPLLRSGLILAGGNQAWNGKSPAEGVEDGIATAYEIAQLNLSTTELVVLSACETALGDIKGNEGVFGLQRAFKMAGVKKMIVSLWQVPDKETAELMSSFYTYWMKGKSIHDAFRQAQAEMRKKYSPFYWAAFVLVE